jgi:hypothetical protein
MEKGAGIVSEPRQHPRELGDNGGVCRRLLPVTGGHGQSALETEGIRGLLTSMRLSRNSCINIGAT